MRSIFTLLLITIGFLSARSQQWNLITGYSLGSPKQAMDKNINAVHSLQAGALYQLPGIKQLSVGVELGIGIYAKETIDQTFQFDNFSSVVPVNYTSNVFNASLLARLNLLPGEKLVNPYVQARGGLYNFFSNVMIEDPNDPYGCEALDRENILNDKTLYWSAGGGLQIDIAAFSKKAQRGCVKIDLGTNIIRGGTIDYINTKHLMDAQTADPDAKPMQVRFVNASTQDIHEHTVAQVYSSPLRLLEFRVGVVVALN